MDETGISLSHETALALGSPADWCERHGIPGYYDKDERARLAELVQTIPDRGRICELGVEYGKSASIYFASQIAIWGVYGLWPKWDIYLVDSWKGTPAARSTFELMITDLNGIAGGRINFNPLWMSTWDAAKSVPFRLDLLHIDADHERGVWTDCALYLPKVKPGGVVVFHDYKRRGYPDPDPTTPDVFPEVTLAVDHHCTSRPETWENLGLVNTQIAFRRLPDRASV